MKIVKFDIQAFQKLQYGGIATYFIELSNQINKSDSSRFRVLQDGLLTSNKSLQNDHFLPMFYNSKALKPIALVLNSKINRITKYDIIHSTYYLESFLKYIRKDRHVITIHDMIPEDFPGYFTGKNPHKEKRKYVENSAGIICVSEYTKKRLLINYQDIDEQSITVVHHASKFSLTEEQFYDVIKNKKRSDQITRILYVGARAGYKNFKVLLEAGHILKLKGMKIEIFCAGGGPITEAEKIIIRNLGLSNLVRQEQVTEVRLKQLYSESLCHVTTSVVEGFGLPLLEAMSLGCPTIITKADALLEVSGGNSVVFDWDDADELANSILLLTENRDFANDKSLNGFVRSGDFSWASTTSKTLSVYNSVLKKIEKRI